MSEGNIVLFIVANELINLGSGSRAAVVKWTLIYKKTKDL